MSDEEGGDVLDRQRTGLWLALFALLAGLAFVVWQYVGALVLGVFVYYVTRPVFERLEPRIPTRTLSVAVTLLLVALPVLLLLAWTVSLGLEQLSVVVGSDAAGQFGSVLDPYLGESFSFERLETMAREALADPSQLGGIDQSVLAVAGAAVGSLLSVLTALLHLFIATIVAFYLLRDDHRMAAWARKTFVPDDGVLESYLVAVDRDLKTVFFGNVLNALFTAVLGIVTYSALNLVAPDVVRIPNPVLVGLLAGIGSLVPVIGIKIVWVPVGGYLLATALLVDPTVVWFVAVFAAVSVVVVDTIPDQLLRPYVSGRTLHVGAIMLAYTIGPLLFGWYGVFLGPLLLVVAVEFFVHVFPWLVDPTRHTEGPSAAPRPTFASDEDAPASQKGGAAADGDAVDAAVDEPTANAAADEAAPEVVTDEETADTEAQETRADVDADEASSED